MPFLKPLLHAEFSPIVHHFVIVLTPVLKAHYCPFTATTALHGLHCMVCTAWSALHGLHCMVCTAWSALHGLHCMVCTAWSALHGLHGTSELQGMAVKSLVNL